MKKLIGMATAALFLLNASPLWAGAPLKGVDVKLGKAGEMRCGAHTGAATQGAGMPPMDMKGQPMAKCASPQPMASPTTDAADEARRATKTRSNIQNN
ncbi:hypothetical protein [Novosphingobium sediminicola]|nr:hypothetical protein [Novosphingobium sediminicola]